MSEETTPIPLTFHCKWHTFFAYKLVYFFHFLQIWSCLCKLYTCHSLGTGTPEDQKICTHKILTYDAYQSIHDDADTTPNLTSQTPQRCLFTPTTSLSFCSIWSEKNVSKIWHTSLVVVAFVGPLLSFSILVGWRMACLLAALLSVKEQLSPWDQSVITTCWFVERWHWSPWLLTHHIRPCNIKGKQNQTEMYERYLYFGIYTSETLQTCCKIFCRFYRDAQPVGLFLHPTKITTAGKPLFKCFHNDLIFLLNMHTLSLAWSDSLKRLYLLPVKK